MILILSSVSDFSTIEIQRWLSKLNAKYIRLNNCNDYKVDICSGAESYLITKNEKIRLKDITSVWFRRKENTELLQYSKNSHSFVNDVNLNLHNEESASYFSLLSNLDKAFWLNTPKDTSLNKYQAIKEANILGIKTPSTLISNNYQSIKDFILKYKKVINKNVRDVRMINYNNKHYTSLVNLVDYNQFLKIDPNVLLLPSLFQEYISKKMEIRTVYINDTFFSMAMFTQKNKQTSVDFRRIYSKENPTRRMPFKLPKDLEKRFRILFEKLEINSGSVDLIVDENDNFYFLEINPIGQFGMTSIPCNYYLEKEFAKTLIENQKKLTNH